MEIATSFGNSGFQDWVIQRVTALVLAVYVIFMIAFFLTHPHLSYAEWRALFSAACMKYSSIIALLALIAHAWIGIWTVTTDYIKSSLFRLPIQIFFILGLMVCFLYGIDILWSVH